MSKGAKIDIVQFYDMKVVLAKNLKIRCVILLAVLTIFTFGCVKREISSLNQTKQNIEISANAININTASAEELEKLPRIGEGFAQKIVEHREKYGKFQRVEEIMLVEGIGEARFRGMREMLKVD